MSKNHGAKCSMLTQYISEFVHIKGIQVDKDGNFTINYTDEVTEEQKTKMNTYAKSLSDKFEEIEQSLVNGFDELKVSTEAEITWEKPIYIPTPIEPDEPIQ